MRIEPTELDGVLLLKPEVFEDFRGQYVCLYSEREYREAGVAPTFVEDDISVSSRHVLRGVHGDPVTWKLVSCLHGHFYLAVLNYDETSPQYGKWLGFTLSATNRHQVLIPPKFGNGHVVLSDTAVFHYKQSAYYDRARQFTVAWNDPRFGIWWPVPAPLLSERDQLGAQGG